MDEQSPESASVPRIRKRHYVYSDLHLGQGRQKDGRWHPMEDFRSDGAFAAMLRHIHEENPPDVQVILRKNGDTFDFMAVPYRGSYLAVPTVEASLEELQAIIEGHREWFEALRWFLSVRPDAEAVFTVGNHDQDLAWPELQAVIRDLLVPADQRHRVRFVREERIGPVDIRHGAEFDPLNAVPPDDQMFITDKHGGSILLIAFLVVALTHGALLPLLKRPGLLLSPSAIVLGITEFVAMMAIIGWAWSKIYFWKWGKTRRFMNYPYAYYMNSSLGMTLKRTFMPDIGRLQDHGAIWVTTMARSPYSAPILWVMLMSHVLYHMFFIDLLSVRSKAGLRTLWKLMASTTHPDRIDEELDRYGKANADVKYVVAGHTHVMGVKNVNIGERTLMYLNTGTWGEQRQMVMPKVDAVTRWPQVEAFFRRIGLYWRNRPFMALGITFVHACVAALPFLSDLVLGWSFGFWAYLFPALSFFLLLWRFSYTEYKGLPFRKLSLAQIDEYENGEIAIALNHFLPSEDGADGHGRFENAL